MPDSDDKISARKRLADEFKALRLEAGLTQEQAGAVLGISYQQIGKYETGKSDIPAHRMDVARRGFAASSTSGNGLAEDGGSYDAPPPDGDQLLSAQWPQLRRQMMRFIKGMNRIAGA